MVYNTAGCTDGTRFMIKTFQLIHLAKFTFKAKNNFALFIYAPEKHQKADERKVIHRLCYITYDIIRISAQTGLV